MTIGLALGTLRNAESVEPDNENNAPAVVPTTLPSTPSEVRLLLESNIRSLQMAFLHNQRTLEIGLGVAQTLRDGVAVLANAQADWIKSVSSARGFFRRTVQPLPPVEVKRLTVQTGGDGGGGDDDGDGDGDEERDDAGSDATATAHWSAAFAPILQSVLQQVGPAVMAWAAQQQAGGGGKAGGKERSYVSSDNATTSWEGRDVLDLRRAQQKGAAHRAMKAADTQAAEETADDQVADEQTREESAAADHAAKLTGAIAAAWSPVLGLDVVKLLQLLPKDTVTKILQVQAALSPDEQADAMQILRRQDAEGSADLIGVFDAATLEESTDLLRRLVVDWRATRAAASKPTTNGGGTSGGGSTSS